MPRRSFSFRGWTNLLILAAWLAPIVGAVVLGRLFRPLLSANSLTAGMLTAWLLLGAIATAAAVIEPARAVRRRSWPRNPRDLAWAAERVLLAVVPIVLAVTTSKSADGVYAYSVVQIVLAVTTSKSADGVYAYSVAAGVVAAIALLALAALLVWSAIAAAWRWAGLPTPVRVAPAVRLWQVVGAWLVFLCGGWALQTVIGLPRWRVVQTLAAGDPVVLSDGSLLPLLVAWLLVILFVAHLLAAFGLAAAGIALVTTGRRGRAAAAVLLVLWSVSCALIGLVCEGGSSPGAMLNDTLPIALPVLLLGVLPSWLAAGHRFSRDGVREVFAPTA